MRDPIQYKRALAVLGLLFGGLLQAAPEPALDEAIQHLQQEWAVANYATPKDAQDATFERLEKAAAMTAQQFPARAEPLVWQAIILSSHAGATGGLSALSRVKQARELLEQAEQIDADTLDGSVYTSLGSLYYQVPGWPLGFGNDKQAESYLQKALAANPQGIDPNYFYGDFLYEQGRYAEAADYLQRALQAPPRPHRELADRGRRDEVQAALERTRAKL